MKDWIMGKNPVIEALKSNHPINKIWISEGSGKGQMQTVIQLAKERGIVVQAVPKRKLDQWSEGNNHQGVMASIAAYEYADFDALLEQVTAKETFPFFLILDEIADPHNLGSMIRTADVVGAHGVIIPKRRAVGLTSTVAKASAGAIQYVPVTRVTNIAQTLDRLKENGLWIVGADAGGDKDYREIDYNMPLALVIGSEGKGISQLNQKKCDILVRLPMKGHVNSLNASVAAAILMYEVFNKRSPLAIEGGTHGTNINR
ncbi:23S rRNA (guanosine(2251)-2'-O)-methyltransferase RlmB [Microaerobacter geothermalis]|uniref:23S rRNA (guanosine(2251)-2'-O)-methyltransferase RlmB n=1 Tax=Microaerobacter geothermalis TaxID=674972 RepID=UPI001F37BC55|nr:23S rRNA (guanosine(2251)-2'-O)-methyltransferase RlmB [Microaerobacter geothermalis]MCF6095178.1 23S rRNA (guanosine(2251)-2'-O)-methyltransferase RlmB [Microaerobacter geothermalis]